MRLSIIIPAFNEEDYLPACLNEVLAHGRLRLSIGPPATPEQTLEIDDPSWRPAVRAAANLLELLEQAPERIRRCQHPARAEA